MGPVEERDRQFSSRWVRFAKLLQRLACVGCFRLQLVGLRLVSLLIDRSGEIGVEPSHGSLAIEHQWNYLDQSYTLEQSATFIGAAEVTASASELNVFIPSITSTDDGIFTFVDTLAFPFILNAQWQRGDGSPNELILSQLLSFPDGNQSVQNIPDGSLYLVGAAATSPVPKPSTFALLGIGSIALVGYSWRRKRQ